MEAIHVIDYSRRLELFETACKVFAAPMEVKRVELYTIFLVVQGNVDLLAVCVDEKSHEEVSERVSSVPG